jgi:hypothetical protein
MSLLHVRQYCMRKGDDAAKVQLVGGIPLGHSRFQEEFRRRTASIGNTDVDSAELTMGRLYELSYAEIVGNIEGVRIDRHTMLPPRFFRDRFQRVTVAGAECEVGALGSERQRGGPTNSLA